MGYDLTDEYLAEARQRAYRYQGQWTARQEHSRPTWHDFSSKGKPCKGQSQT